MKSEIYNQIIDEVYEKWVLKNQISNESLITKAKFIHRIENDREFSKENGITRMLKFDGKKTWAGIVYQNDDMLVSCLFDQDKVKDQTDPIISDNFLIGPDGAYEYGDEESLSDWDVTLNDGLDDL